MLGWIVVGVCAAGLLISILVVSLRRFKLTFDTNGVKFDDEILAIKARKGQKVYLPELISPKHEFLGWFYDKACTEKFEGEKMIGTNATLYAGWKKKKSKNQEPAPMTYTDYILHNISFNIALDW